MKGSKGERDVIEDLLHNCDVDRGVRTHWRPRLPVLVVWLGVLLSASIWRTAYAQETRFREEIRVLAERAAVARALADVEAASDSARTALTKLTEIPAPPFGESRRAEAFAGMLREAGADSVWIDSVGNVLALRRGAGSGRTVALAGHMDTVFPEGSDVSVRTRGDTLYAPGVGDDTRGLIVVWSALGALSASGLRTESDVLFVGTVGEEGLGDLRGVKHLFGPSGPRIDSWIAVDGGDDGRIVTGALASHRYRVTFRGPGGHSWGDFGNANPHHALGRAIHFFDGAADQYTSRGSKTSYNVGRIGGGTSVNSIPFESWMEVDMRSESPERLLEVDSIFQAAVLRALSEANLIRRAGDSLTVEITMIGDRPSGRTSPTLPLVQRAMSVTSYFGDKPVLVTSSTDSNIPISRGIPALTISRGGVSGGTHSPGEWWLDRDAAKAVKKAFLLLVAEAGLKN